MPATVSALFIVLRSIFYRGSKLFHNQCFLKLLDSLDPQLLIRCPSLVRTMIVHFVCPSFGVGGGQRGREEETPDTPGGREGQVGSGFVVFPTRG